MHQQKGFSFIEVLVSIAIMAIVTGIALPVYFNMKPTMQINGAARKIMDDLMWVKMRSVSENNDYVMTFGTETNSYNIYDDNDNDFVLFGPETGELVRTGTIGTSSGKYTGVSYGFVPDPNVKRTDNNSTLNSNVTFPIHIPSGNMPWVRFRPNGRPAEEGEIYLILDEDEANGINGRKERMRAISLSIAGLVKIWKYNMGENKWK